MNLFKRNHKPRQPMGIHPTAAMGVQVGIWGQWAYAEALEKAGKPASAKYVRAVAGEEEDAFLWGADRQAHQWYVDQIRETREAMYLAHWPYPSTPSDAPATRP